MRRTGGLVAAVAAITVVIAIGGCSRSDPPEGHTGGVGTGGAGADVDSDGEFVRDVAMKYIAQLELSRMALARATRSDVKAFAQQVIDEHGAAGNELKSIADKHAIAWPAQLEEEHRETAEELGQKQGVEFDREYVETMVDAHQDLAAKLESRLDVQSLSDWKTAAAARTRDQAMPQPEVAMSDVPVRPGTSDNEITSRINQWAAETYPTAQKHLDTARTLENATK